MGLVGVLVGVDHLLVRAPGDLHSCVPLVCEQPGQPGLLDLAAGPIEGVAGELDHVEGVHDRPGVRQLLSDGGLVPGQAVHRHDLDPLAPGGVALGQPGGRRAPCRPGAPGRCRPALGSGRS